MKNYKVESNNEDEIGLSYERKDNLRKTQLLSENNSNYQIYNDIAFPINISKGHTKSMQTRKDLGSTLAKEDKNLMLICTDYDTFGDKGNLNNTQKYSNASNLKITYDNAYQKEYCRDKENKIQNKHRKKSRSITREARRRSNAKSIPKSEQIHKSKIETSIYEMINYLSAYGIVTKDWNNLVNNENFKILKARITKLFKYVFTDKETKKIKLIKDILDKQITFQEEALAKVLKKQTIGNKLEKEKQITQDAIVILNEISEIDLNISCTSYEEAKYYENYGDPEFQELITLLKRLCKREMMLITIMKQRVSEVEEDKESVEQALLSFMNKSSNPIINSSNLDDSYLCKNMTTLKNANKKLLSENELAFDNTKNQFDQASIFTKSDNKDGLKSYSDLEYQIKSLLKTISRSEKIIDEKDSFIYKLNEESKKNSDLIESLKAEKQKLENDLNQRLNNLTSKSESDKSLFDDTLRRLNDQISDKSDLIFKIENENKKLQKLITEKDQTISDGMKIKQELMDVKIEYNKLKLIFDNDILTKYEQSLKEASDKLKEAEQELERTQTFYQDQIEQIKINMNEDADKRVEDVRREIYKKDKIIFKATRKAK